MPDKPVIKVQQRTDPEWIGTLLYLIMCLFIADRAR